MKRIFITVVALSLTIFAAVHWKKSRPNQEAEPSPPSVSGGNAARTFSAAGGSPKTSSATATVPTNPNLTSEALLQQARAMNRVFPNAQAALAEENRLEAVAASLTEADRSFLVEQVTNAEAGDNIRALSLYLLTLAPSTTPENLKAVALMPNPVAGMPLAEHSPEEWQDRTVKAFATGAVGELKKRLPQDPSIVRDLQEISQQASMPIVKRMARNYLREAESREPASLQRRKK